jgi:hypothetical protein
MADDLKWLIPGLMGSTSDFLIEFILLRFPGHFTLLSLLCSQPSVKAVSRWVHGGYFTGYLCNYGEVTGDTIQFET